MLFTFPAKPWSVATTFDGYPLAQPPRQAKADGVVPRSFVGALFAVIMITFLAPRARSSALRFGPPDSSQCLLTFCSFIRMGKGSPWKTLCVDVAGLALAAIGMDNITGRLRLTFGSPELHAGVDFPIAVISLFGIGEIPLLSERAVVHRRAQRSAEVVFGVAEASALQPSLRSCLIGARWMRSARRCDARVVHELRVAEEDVRMATSCGTGQLEGVVAPETAAHAAG